MYYKTAKNVSHSSVKGTLTVPATTTQNLKKMSQLHLLLHSANRLQSFCLFDGL